MELNKKEIFFYNMAGNNFQGLFLQFPFKHFKSKIIPIKKLSQFKEKNLNFILVSFLDIDNKWNNKNYKLLNLLNKEHIDLINNGVVKLLIDYSLEGWNLEYMGFSKMLDILKDKNINGNNVYFICADLKLKDTYNSLYKNLFEKINIIGINVCIIYLRNWEIFDVDVENLRPKKFVCLNALLRRDRRLLITELFRSGLDKEGFITAMGRSSKIHKQFPNLQYYPETHEDVNRIFLENEIPFNIKDEKIIQKYYEKVILPKLPIFTDIDHALMKSNNKDVDEQYLNTIFPKFYTDSYFSIVTETSFNWNTESVFDNGVFLSEKIWKPIFGMQPFVVFSNTYYLKILRDLGFKTFPEFFDESYDEVEDPIERFYMIFDEIKKVCSLSIEEIHDKYNSIFNKLIYNRQKLLEMLDVDNFKNSIIKEFK
tara:strand:- start:42 stop:1319 length:1278 start_codon:yes stop_codon:yes gene_type:complete